MTDPPAEIPEAQDPCVDTVFFDAIMWLVVTPPLLKQDMPVTWPAMSRLALLESYEHAKPHAWRTQATRLSGSRGMPTQRPDRSWPRPITTAQPPAGTRPSKRCLAPTDCRLSMPSAALGPVGSGARGLSRSHTRTAERPASAVPLDSHVERLFYGRVPSQP
jgi:hypothetical protein